MTRFRFLILVIACIALLSTACQFEAPAATNQTSGSSAAGTSPAAVTPLAPSGNAGAVHGALIKRDTQQPFPDGLDLYLAEVLSSNDNSASVAGLDKAAAPRAAMGANGTFAFSKVKPGKYALVAVSPINQTLIPDPKNSDQYVVVTVEPNKTSELGKLVLDLKY